MKKNRKNEEGAVLLLLIVMMSAVVLIVASLLRFNTQNIKFAAIEAENEQALYLAEGVADSIEFYLLEKLANDDEIEPSEIGQLMVDYTASEHVDYRYGVTKLLFPSDTLVGESDLSGVTIGIARIDKDGIVQGSFQPDNNLMYLKITVSGGNSSRSIAVTYLFPETKPTDGDYESFITSKNMNYSNSL